MKVIPAKKTIGSTVSGSTIAQTQENISAASSMAEYENLKFRLLVTTAILSGIIFLTSWLVYGLSTALNYLLGACVGVVYLRMLARSVDQLSKQNHRPGFARFAVVSILIIVTSRWDQFRLLPVILGFMTYKAAILVYALQDLTRVSRSS